MSRTRHPWAQLRAEMLDSPARAFTTLYRRFQAAATAAYACRGWKNATLSHVQFLAETEEGGTRLSDVAAALDTTKQYAGKLARDLERKRFITLVADPADRRAVLARRRGGGRAFFADASEVRAELEREFLAKLSPSRSTTFVAILEDL